MANIGYDKAFGARPLRRIFQKELEDYMATQMLTGAYQIPTIIEVHESKDKFEFKERPWEDYGLSDESPLLLSEDNGENKEVAKV